MAAIVTTNMRVYAANQFISGFSTPGQNLYIFIGRTLPWDQGAFPYAGSNDNSPPTPIDCEYEEAVAFRDMMSAKLISPSMVSLVVPRYDWTSGTVYTQYMNTIDLFDPSGGLAPFFVITDALNVYKCLNNNGGVASTVKPTNTTTNVVTSADGYQWKYMYTVNSADVLNFVTNEWYPVKTLSSNDGSNQWLVQQAAISGTIDRIDMVSIGSQYTVLPTVTIVGDGTGATASAVINAGNITSIVVTSAGSNYTWANVVISGGGVGANGAAANAVISPLLGHGADPVTELGGFFVLIDSKLTYDENGTFTVSNDYRRVGILKNPLLNNGITPANDLDYDQMWRLTFGTVSGTTFVGDEIVLGSASGATGVVVDYDPNGINPAGPGPTLRLAEVVGAFIPGETVVGSVATGVLLTTTGTATGGTGGAGSTIVLPNSASASANAYTGQTVFISSGLGTGQTRIITNYVGTNRTATVNPPWSIIPNGTSVYKIASIVAPDLAPYQGEIVYLENRRPIARSSDQVEDVKIVVEF